jgi:uncharacterized repeat protein (TIGR01451 family)
VKVPDVLLLFIAYTIVVAAAIGAYIYFSARRPRPKQNGLAIPNVEGLKVKRTQKRAQGNIVAWPLSESKVPASPSEPARNAGEPVNVSPSAESRVPVACARRPETIEGSTQLAVSGGPVGANDPATIGDPGSALSRVFGPRDRLLPEGLRTLEVLPNRIVQPGTTVRAAVTLRNLGGGSASGFRVRFRLPEGLTYIGGTARIDDTPLEDRGAFCALLEPPGADIGEIPAAGERRVSLAFTVAATIENGTPVTLQAAIASPEVPVIGSNVVRLLVRSLPMLENPETTLVLAALRDALPGEELQFNARIHNSGQSSAHDLIVLLPLPANTTLVPQSVTIDGRAPAAGSEGFSLGFTRPTVVARRLEPGATIDIGFRMRIDTPLEDATQITAAGAVCSREVAEFSLPPVSVKIPSAPSFAGEETSFRVECEDELEPGESVRIVLYATNDGTASARKLSLRIELPDGMVYTAGSLAIDGAPTPDRDAMPDAIRLGDLEPGRSVELALSAIVHAPIADNQELRLAATVAWSKGQRKFERIARARSAPRFPLTFNKIERETQHRVLPGDPIAFTIALLNMGTDVATGARLQLIVDEGIERLRVFERDAEIAAGADGTIGLEPLEPGVSRSLRVEGNVAGTIEDQTQLRLHATLLTAQVARIDLGAPVHVVDSRPRFATTSSLLAACSDEALRFRRASLFRLTLVNEGTDNARDVRVALDLPEELEFESVDDATRDGNAVVFGDIPAGQRREAVLHIRLVGIAPGDEPLTLAGHVSGLNVVPFGLNAIELATHAEASFTQATLSAQPAETVDAGAQIAYTLVLPNSGDGIAKLLTTRVSSLTNGVYAQGTTTVNGIALQDRAGTSLLFGDDGLRLADVGPAIEVIVSWRTIVNTPLPPSAMVETIVCVRWDDAPVITVTTAPVSVIATAALPIIEPGLPFSVLGAIAALPKAAPAGGPESGRGPSDYAELRPALPVRRIPSVSNRDEAIESIGQAQLTGGSVPAEPPPPEDYE